MTRRASWLALAFLALAATIADAKPRKYSWEINPYMGSRDYDASLDGITTHGVRGINLGYNVTHHWEVEAGFSYDPDNHDRTLFREGMDVETFDLGFRYNFNTGPDNHDTRGRWYSWDRWIPYAGLSLGHFAIKDRVLGVREGETAVGVLGTRIMVTDWVGLRFEARDVQSLDDGDFDGEKFNNLEGDIGVTFIVGGAVPRDSDSDGVLDGIDRCPGTPIGCWVDEWGCPKDSDSDGVCDGLDRCPNTPIGCPVDASGCSPDEDGDGVCDGLDNCPGTPKGCWVDTRGCPKDSDGDGVCDGVDKCPDTPKECKVDATGCPLDEDGDGVCDGIDLCPGTPRGTKVDAKGCPVDVVKLLLSSVHFEFDRSAIQPFYEVILDEVAKSLLKDENRTVELELRGHTDAIASEDYNYRLGQARADNVKTYLVNRGVAPARIVTKSYSELEPIAPNTKADGSDNPEGRALNRRVEMVPTSGDSAGRIVDIKILARDVMFAPGGADLTAESRAYLDQLANVFNPPEASHLRFTITGKATGANAAALSQQRAEAVAAYLTGKGIARERMTVTGGGGSGNSATVVPTK